MKGDRYTPFESIPVGTVFRYVPDYAGMLGPRLKISAEMCCRPAWFETHGRLLSPDDIAEAPWGYPRDVFLIEPETRVRVTLADNPTVSPPVLPRTS